MKSADDKKFKKPKTLYSARDREVAKRQNTTKKKTTRSKSIKAHNNNNNSSHWLVENQCIPASFDVTKKNNNESFHWLVESLHSKSIDIRTLLIGRASIIISRFSSRPKGSQTVVQDTPLILHT